jgi:hypothetical protein
MTTKPLSQVFSNFVPKKSLPSTNANDDGMKTEATDASEPAPAPEEEEMKLPTYDELPMFKDMPGCAWSLWGEKDQLGTVNLLTEEVVARAANEEIKYCSLIL